MLAAIMEKRFFSFCFFSAFLLLFFPTLSDRDATAETTRNDIEQIKHQLHCAL